MTQEEKQLLFKDLCGRLPYGVICKLSAKDANVLITEKLELGGLEHFIVGSMCVKPYLLPMSSMTEENVVMYYCYLICEPQEEKCKDCELLKIYREIYDTGRKRP